MNELYELGESTGSLIKMAVELATALLCVGASRHSLERKFQAQRTFWRSVAIVLLLLCVNSLLHGDSLWLTSVRDTTKAYGLYEWRRVFQLVLLIAAVPLVLAVHHRLQRMLQALPERVLSEQVLSGLTLVLVVMGLNFLSFHYTDQLIYWDIAGISLGNWLEGLGLALVGQSALRSMVNSVRRGSRHV